jgi:myo-inositol-1(or 4)-monophosphatase
MPLTDRLSDLLELARASARAAGGIAKGYFRPGSRTSAEIQYKDGGSPVTEADFAVDEFLKQRLREAEPGFGWLSEETEDDIVRMDHRYVWVVDPIDGTRSFARGAPDWTIAIGLLDEGRPILGVVYAPVSDEMFEARRGGGAFLNGHGIRASARDTLAGARIIGPGPLVDAVAAASGPFEITPRVHSLALRLARVAQGQVDVAVAEADAHDWDLVGAHAIMVEAGSMLIGRTGEIPLYNRESTRHPSVAAGPEPLARELAHVLQKINLDRIAIEDSDPRH